MEENLHNEDFYKNKVIELAKEIQRRRLEKRGIVTQEVEPTYVIYARRSTKAPKDNKEKDKIDKQERSISDQLKACKKFAEDNGLKVLAIETEEETAHKSDKRDVFYKILDIIKSGNSYNSIIAWHPDRLARNMRDSGTIIDLLDSGIIVDLKFPSFTFVNDPSGKMALGIQFVLAKNYSDGLSVSTNRGIEGTIEDAKYSGKAKHGYTAKKGEYYRPDKETFPKVQQLWQEAMEGKTAKELEKLSAQIGYPMQYKAILNMLHEPFYAGIYLHGNNLVDIRTVDLKFTPIVSFKDFITIDRNISERQSFEHTNTIENILFKKMVKCFHCDRFMSPYKSKGKYGDYYYYVGCSNNDCETKKDRSLKRTVRGKVIMDYVIEVLERKLNITQKVYEDAIRNYSQSRLNNIKLIEINISTVNKQITDLKTTIEGLSRSLAKSTIASEDAITDSINEKSELLAERKDELRRLEEELIKIESKISDDAMPYEKFSNFFKKAGQTIKSNLNPDLLDQLVRNIFSNFFVENGKVIGHKLKEPFATYENLGSDIMGS